MIYLATIIDEVEILDYLLNHEVYKEYCLDLKPYPKEYHYDINKVKAVVLGADPSNNNEELEYVFGLEEKEDSKYFRMTLGNLKEVGLKLEQLYVQNLCKNYFKYETTENDKWSEIAELWVPCLRKELDSLFDKSIPVFITAGKIRDVLCYDVKKGKDYKSNYEKAEFIMPEENKLGRIIIPLYRHWNYKLSEFEWKDYRDKIYYTFND